MAFIFKRLTRKLKPLKPSPLLDCLREMDLFFAQKPWGTFEVPWELAPLMGGFTEEAVDLEDLGGPGDEVLEDLFGGFKCAA
jgi:hypothetical protein